MLTAYRTTRHLPPQSPSRLQQRNHPWTPRPRSSAGVPSVPGCPTSSSKATAHAQHVCSCHPREGRACQMGTAAFTPSRSRLARSPECHPRRTWPCARERADTFFQTQNPHGVQGVDQRQAQAKPLTEGPGHRFQLVVAPGKLAVSGPRVAEGIDHGPLTLVRGGWKEDSRSPGPARWVTA